MARVRVSTTVDEHLLESAREALAPLTDAAVLDRALAALGVRVVHARLAHEGDFFRHDSAKLADAVMRLAR